MIPVYTLDPNSVDFPDVEQALDKPDGLLAIGGDLSTQRLLSAYRRGIFPWYQQGEPIAWWAPHSRGFLKLDQLHISKSTRKLIKKADYIIRVNHNFKHVMIACAAPRGPNNAQTWITADMMQAYQALHQLGHAHCIEVWQGSELVGGLYGIDIGGIFCGESMFCTQPNMSKIALYHLVHMLRPAGYFGIDCQLMSPHLEHLGARPMLRRDFTALLEFTLSLKMRYSWEKWRL